MATIEITRVGTSDLTALKRNFANLLQEKFGSKRPTTLQEAIAARGLKEPKVRSVKFWNSRKLADRSKVWPSSKPCGGYYWGKTDAEMRDLNADLNQIDNITAYVRAWTILNHLKEA